MDVAEKNYTINLIFHFSEKVLSLERVFLPLFIKLAIVKFA